MWGTRNIFIFDLPLHTHISSSPQRLLNIEESVLGLKSRTRWPCSCYHVRRSKYFTFSPPPFPSTSGPCRDLKTTIPLAGFMRSWESPEILQLSISPFNPHFGSVSGFKNNHPACRLYVTMWGIRNTLNFHPPLYPHFNVAVLILEEYSGRDKKRTILVELQMAQTW